VSDPVDVRRLESRDVAEWEHTLRDLLLENAQVNFPRAEAPTVMAEGWFANLARFVDDGSAVALGAFEDGALKGLVWAYRREVAGQARMHLGHIVVAVDARSRGLGQRLLEAVERAARDEGVNTIELLASVDNTSASRFYAANGFVATRVQMEKDLSVPEDNQ